MAFKVGFEAGLPLTFVGLRTRVHMETPDPSPSHFSLPSSSVLLCEGPRVYYGTPSTYRPKGKPCAGSENGIWAVWAGIQRSQILRLCGLEYGEGAGGGPEQGHVKHRPQIWAGGQSMRRQLCASNMVVTRLDSQVTRIILVAEQSMDWTVGEH